MSKEPSGWKLIGACTLRVAGYGLIGGAVSGVFLYVIGALFGAVIGLFLGLLVGFAEGLALWIMEALWSYRIKLAQRVICCIVTSLAVDAIVGVVSYDNADGLEIYGMYNIVTTACVLGVPALVVSAVLLARWVTARYYMRPTAELVRPVVNDSEAWPPTPRTPR